MVAGSDAHFPEHIGMCYTIIYSEPDEQSIYDAIRSGQTAVSGKTSGLLNKNLISRMRHLVTRSGRREKRKND
jgi:hypothetical protein